MPGGWNVFFVRRGSPKTLRKFRYSSGSHVCPGRAVLVSLYIRAPSSNGCATVESQRGTLAPERGPAHGSPLRSNWAGSVCLYYRRPWYTEWDRFARLDTSGWSRAYPGWGLARCRTPGFLRAPLLHQYEPRWHVAQTLSHP